MWFKSEDWAPIPPARTMSAAARKIEQPAPDAGVDRRTARRLRADTLPDLAARLVAGPDVTLIDVSKGGARFESDTRLLPGSGVGLRLVQGEALFLVMARVVRSRVARLESGSLRYESAVAFDKECPMFTDADVVPTPNIESASAPVDEVTLVAAEAAVDAESQRPEDATPPAAPRTPRQPRVLTFTAVVPKSGPDVRRLLSSNRW